MASSARAQPPTSVSSVTHRTVVWMDIDFPLSQPRCIGRGYFGGATANIATSGHCEAPERAASEARHDRAPCRSEEHTSELQSLMRISYAVFCLNKKNLNSNSYISTRLLHKQNIIR